MTPVLEELYPQRGYTVTKNGHYWDKNWKQLFNFKDELGGSRKRYQDPFRWKKNQGDIKLPLQNYLWKDSEKNFQGKKCNVSRKESVSQAFIPS